MPAACPHLVLACNPAREQSVPACSSHLNRIVGGFVTTWNDFLVATQSLRAAAGSAAVFALVAGAVAGHHAAAFGAQRGVADEVSLKLKGLLWLGFGGAELRHIAGFGRFGDAEEARA